MKLHEDKKLFTDTLRAAAEHLNIKLEFVEKDYWITLVLSRLANSKYVAASVFKGGTSLSKGYNLIERFSTDVDIAIIDNMGKTGNQVRTIIRNIEKEMTVDLRELQMDEVTSKGSRFRKSVFEYASTDKDNMLIVEVNSFANPFPYKMLSIQSFVFYFLIQTGNEAYIKEYNLEPFEVNVLSKEQTLMEKMVSLIRCSFEENTVAGLQGKIRHFYDLYFLMKDEECAAFISSEPFKQQFEVILQHDREMFEEPKGWQKKLLSESPLVNDFDNIWKQLKDKYQTELSALAYRPIPSEAVIAKHFSELINGIK